MTLFSLSANAGAAMAAAVVQPGAAGLDGYPDPSQSDSSESIEDARRDDGNTGAGSVEGFREGRRVVGAEGGRVSRCRGVVLEALDSRILEEALVAAMGRLGLGVACRSRWEAREIKTTDAVAQSVDNARVEHVPVSMLYRPITYPD